MHAAAEDRLHIALLARGLLRRLHVVPDAGKALEIGADVVSRLLPADAELVGKPEGGDAVDDAEVDGLGPAAHHRVHALDRHAEHFGRRHRMDVLPLGESLFQLRNVRHMGHDAQLDLAVVGADELRAFRSDEGGADLAALLRAHRNVLQVGLGGGEPARGGRRQRVGRVDALRLRIDEVRQSVRIGGAELRELAPVEHAAGEFDALRCQVFERVRIGAPCSGLGLPAAGQAHAAEEDVAQLLGRADVEALPRELVDLHLDSGGSGGEFVRQAAQDLRIDQDAFHLHRRQDADERALERFVDGALSLCRQPGLEQQPEAQRHVRILRRVARGVCYGHAVEGDHRLARARHILEGDAGVIEMALGQLVHAMADVARFQHVGHQHRVVDRGDGDAVALQHLDVIFEVLAHLEDRRVLEERLQHGDGFGERDLAFDRLAAEEPAARGLVLQRNVAGPAGREASDTPTRLARIESSESVSVSSAMYPVSQAASAHVFSTLSDVTVS